MHLDPSTYPWTSGLPARRGRLTPAGLQAGDVGEDLDRRVPVVAVGSNASPTVLARKLGPALERGLPVSVGAVDGLAVGHSAHVSTRGYVAAAPARGPGEQRVTVGWFDPGQLAALDATEPNYRRVALPEGMACRAAVVGPGEETVVRGAQVYASVHGVVGERGTPLPLGDQATVLAWIARRLPGLGDRLTHRRLAEPALRERVRAGLVRAGLVVRPGLLRGTRGQVAGP